MTQGAAARYDEEFLSVTRSHIPMGRPAGPHETGEAVASLARDKTGTLTRPTPVAGAGVMLRETPAGFPHV